LTRFNGNNVITDDNGNVIATIDSSGVLHVAGVTINDAAGVSHARSTNAAVAAQSSGGFAADTYVTNSDLLVPSLGIQQKAVIEWRISASKTAASTGTPVYTIRCGTARTTSDTSVLALTGPAQTAVADIGTLIIMATVTTAGASAIVQGTAWWVHRGTAANTTTSGTGFANDTSGHVEGTGSAVDLSAAAGKYVGLSIAGGASSAWTVTQCVGQGYW
jgi:hypothetical protein